VGNQLCSGRSVGRGRALPAGLLVCACGLAGSCPATVGCGMLLRSGSARLGSVMRVCGAKRYGRCAATRCGDVGELPADLGDRGCGLGRRPAARKDTPASCHPSVRCRPSSAARSTTSGSGTPPSSSRLGGFLPGTNSARPGLL